MVNQRAEWNFDNTYARLPDMFFIRQNPVPVSDPRMILFNLELAVSLGLPANGLSNAEGAEIFAGNRIPPGADPIAQAYAGHQFGHLNMLGDGRALLLGEQITPTGERFDIQLKGSGQTPFSRRGDGRAALGPMLREYIISEAMFRLGIPTTRSLAVVSTGDPVYRETLLPGAVLARVAKSHIRVGTFVYAASVQGGEDGAVRALSDYTIKRHFPHLETDADKYMSFLRAVVDRQASLVAQWMLIGFIHGVLNTDNVAISGETIDYGPCAFMDHYSPTTVFSSIDRNGRYAYGNQPQITAWNLARMAETLLPLLAPRPEEAVEKAKEAIEEFSRRFQLHYETGMRGKLGLTREEEGDPILFSNILSWMENQKADYTNTFRALSSETLLADPQFQVESFQKWLIQWRQRLERQEGTQEQIWRRMEAHNPAVIPRNHRVEEALAGAVENSDFSLVEKLLKALEFPFADSPLHQAYRDPAPAGGERYRTFCGT